MSHLLFRATRAYLHEEYGRPSNEYSLGGRQESPDDPKRGTTLTIHVEPDPETRVKLATGERLSEIDGSITFKPSDDALPIASADKSKKQIGYMRYMPPYNDDTVAIKGHYSLWALIPEPQFGGLVSAIQNGRASPSIFVDVEGFTLPDEFSLEWDNKNKTILPVVSISFSTPIAQFPPIDGLDDKEQLAGFMPLTRADLTVAVEKASQPIQRLNTKLNWVLVAAAVIIVLLWRLR